MPHDENRRVDYMAVSPKQMISESCQPIPMTKGRLARVDYEYFRHGMVNVYFANEPLKGKRVVEITEFKKK